MRGFQRRLAAVATAALIASSPAGDAAAAGGSERRVTERRTGRLRSLERLPGKLGVALTAPLGRIATLRAHLHRLRRVHSGEPGRRTPSLVGRHPLLRRIARTVEGLDPRTGKRLRHEVARLQSAVGGEIALPAGFRGGRRAELSYRAERLGALAELGRKPSEISAGFVDVAPAVLSRVGPGEKDVHLDGRKIYYERWRARDGEARGTVLVVPGYQETGRSYYALADELNSRGYDVYMMDQQWAGLTRGRDSELSPGQIDSGFGVARDVAAMEAFTKAIAKRAGHELVVVGSSMGAGRGMLLGSQLADRGALDGVQLFERDATAEGIALGRLGAVRSTEFASQPINPFVEPTPNRANRLAQLMGKIWGLRELSLRPMGLPRLNHSDAASQAEIAALGLRENVYLQPSAMARSADALAYMKESAAKGFPRGRIAATVMKGDTLANSKATRALLEQLPDARVDQLSGTDHVLQHNPAHVQRFADTVDRLFDN